MIKNGKVYSLAVRKETGFPFKEVFSKLKKAFVLASKQYFRIDPPAILCSVTRKRKTASTGISNKRIISKIQLNYSTCSAVMNTIIINH